MSIIFYGRLMTRSIPIHLRVWGMNILLSIPRAHKPCATSTSSVYEHNVVTKWQQQERKKIFVVRNGGSVFTCNDTWEMFDQISSVLTFFYGSHNSLLTSHEQKLTVVSYFPARLFFFLCRLTFWDELNLLIRKSSFV